MQKILDDNKIYLNGAQLKLNLDLRCVYQDGPDLWYADIIDFSFCNLCLRNIQVRVHPEFWAHDAYWLHQNISVMLVFSAQEMDR